MQAVKELASTVDLAPACEALCVARVKWTPNFGPPAKAGFYPPAKGANTP
jgi:hypothetical protein